MDEDKHTPKGVKKLVLMISKLEPQEFLGVCKLLGVELYEGENDEDLASRETTGIPTKDELIEMNKDVVVRPAENLLEDVIDEICQLNRVRRRNLERIVRSATKGR